MVDIASEHRVLDGLLLIPFAIAPYATNRFFLGSDRVYAIAHAVAFTAVLVSSLAGSGLGAFAWAAFCGFGIVLFLRRARQIGRAHV